MRTRVGVSVIFLIALVLSGCGPKLKPGEWSGTPDPVFYGACSPHRVGFVFAWPDESGWSKSWLRKDFTPSDLSYDPTLDEVVMFYTLYDKDMNFLLDSSVLLSTAGGAFTGLLDMNGFSSDLAGEEGYLEYGPSIHFQKDGSGSGIYAIWQPVDAGKPETWKKLKVEPCPPPAMDVTIVPPVLPPLTLVTKTPTPLSPTETPVKKEKCKPGPNNPCP